MQPDFVGCATKFGVLCSDGTIIHSGAFQKQDGATVPLVWNHVKDNPSAILGKVQLQHEDDGVYGIAFFNDTSSAKHSKELVHSGDIHSLSIRADNLLREGGDIYDGTIREVSLVQVGANPGARIIPTTIQHADGGVYESETEADIFFDIPIEFIEHSDSQEEASEESSGEKKTIEDIIKTMNDEQLSVVDYLLTKVLEDSDEEDSKDEADSIQQSGETTVARNVFAQNAGDQDQIVHAATTAEAWEDFLAKAKTVGFKNASIEHAKQYGVKNVEALFPEAKSITGVEPVLVRPKYAFAEAFTKATSKQPFTKIKSSWADMTPDELRARGWVRGSNAKADDAFAVASRETTPTWVYVRTKLDREDILSITDFSVVNFVQKTQSVRMYEELGLAALFGDGRAVSHKDKIKEDHIRPILTDDPLFTIQHTLAKAEKTELDKSPINYLDEFLKALKDYEGVGATLYLAQSLLIKILTQRDTHGRRIVGTEAELISQLPGVSHVVGVPFMEGLTKKNGGSNQDVLALMVNPSDYVFSSPNGGDLTRFEDFDIDFNQYTYLLEAYTAGALREPKTAVAVLANQA